MGASESPSLVHVSLGLVAVPDSGMIMVQAGVPTHLVEVPVCGPLRFPPHITNGSAGVSYVADARRNLRRQRTRQELETYQITMRAVDTPIPKDKNEGAPFAVVQTPPPCEGFPHSGNVMFSTYQSLWRRNLPSFLSCPLIQLLWTIRVCSWYSWV